MDINIDVPFDRELQNSMGSTGNLIGPGGIHSSFLDTRIDDIFDLVLILGCYLSETIHEYAMDWVLHYCQ